MTPGLSNALAFKAQASTITSVDQILGNPTMRTVVTTALGIPEQIAFQDLTAQENAISSRIDLTKFKDPKFVETFVQQYLIANAGSASAASTPDLTTWRCRDRAFLPDCSFQRLKRSPSMDIDSSHGRCGCASQPSGCSYRRRTTRGCPPAAGRGAGFGAAVRRTRPDRRPHRVGQRRMGSGIG